MSDTDTRKQDVQKHCPDELAQFTNVMKNADKDSPFYRDEVTRLLKHTLLELGTARRLAGDAAKKLDISGYAIFGCTIAGKFEQSSITFAANEFENAMFFYRNFSKQQECKMFAQINVNHLA